LFSYSDLRFIVPGAASAMSASPDDGPRLRHKSAAVSSANLVLWNRYLCMAPGYYVYKRRI